MEAILVRPDSERQAAAIKSFFETVGVAFSSVSPEAELPEEDRFWPELDRKIDRALKERARGESYKVSTESFGKFMESI